MILLLLRMEKYSRWKIPLEEETPDQLQNIDLIDLVRGGSNDTAAINKIAGAVIDMSQYSYEEQTSGKQRKIEWGGG
jgi:hypothetical protein